MCDSSVGNSSMWLGVSLAPNTVNMSFLVDRDNLFPSVYALFLCFFAVQPYCDESLAALENI